MDFGLLIIELLKIVLPALIVAAAMFYLVKTHLDRDYQRKLLELKVGNARAVIPVRLQAYERVCLFLERISPSNMLIRIPGSAVSATEYHRILLTEIRDEFNHNASQQVYMSQQTWDQVKRAKEDLVTLINRCQHQMNERSKGTELAKRILETVITEETEPTANALVAVKREIQVLF